MTLDPVHHDAIARLARSIGGDVTERDHRDLAETVWESFLDPLYATDGDYAVLEPVDDVERYSADVAAVALDEAPFPTTHALDSGTINPTTFKNGLVLDVAQAAMAACPSDLELHRGRTIVMAAHTNDATHAPTTDWQVTDGGYCRQRVFEVPRIDRYAEGVVHALALYMAESTHAIENADVVADLLYLDGPLYPKGMLTWLDRDPALASLLVDEDQPRATVQTYVDLVESFVERDVPLVGFVKNPSGAAVTRTLRARTDAPWVDDAALFRQVLERRADGERRTDALSATGWFVSRGGADRVMSTAGDRLDVDMALDPAAYEVTVSVVYDPRDDVVYAVEAPAAVTADPDVREAITRQVLAAVAAERGPPLAVRKADDLARISREEKESLRGTLERSFDAERDRTYDDLRWPLLDG